MDYDSIKGVAYDYADRLDNVEATNRYDSFLRMVESRINKRLRIFTMSNRAIIATIKDKEYYGLPADFLSLRDIEIRPNGESIPRQTAIYLNPEQMNNVASNTTCFYYTIIAQQIQIRPAKEDMIMEVVYHRKVGELSQSLNNWVAEDYPDCYVFGLLVEINAFVRDANAAALWGERFSTSLEELTVADNSDRWSGIPLTTKIES